LFCGRLFVANKLKYFSHSAGQKRLVSLLSPSFHGDSTQLPTGTTRNRPSPTASTRPATPVGQGNQIPSKTVLSLLTDFFHVGRNGGRRTPSPVVESQKKPADLSPLLAIDGTSQKAIFQKFASYSSGRVFSVALGSMVSVLLL
jgi:hypothetical protein